MAFCEHINHSLAKDEYMTDPAHKPTFLPMSPETDDLFRACADGILLRCVRARALAHALLPLLPLLPLLLL